MCVCVVCDCKEVDAIEAEMKVMEKDVAKIKSSLNVQEGISRDKLKVSV